jgi:uncharacterized protein (DUF934 family)
MPLISDGRLVDDVWLSVADDDALPATGRVIVSLSRWQAERDALRARREPVGVRLRSSDRVDSVAADVAAIALIAIEFPTFRDGRPYSMARILRQHLGFSGELRAVGNVLQDQLLFMHRCGFDAFEIAEASALDAWRRAMDEISVFYQPAADVRLPAAALRLRRSAAE